MAAKEKNGKEAWKAQRRRRRFSKARLEHRRAKATLTQLEETAAAKRADLDRSRRRANRGQAKLRRAESELEGASTARRKAFEHNERANICIDLGLAILEAQDQGDSDGAADLTRALRELMASWQSEETGFQSDDD